LRFLKHSNQARKPISFPLFLALIAATFWLILRVVLWIDVGPAQMSTSQSLTAFGVGLWFDIWTLAYIITPWLLASALLPNSWRAHRVAHIIRWCAAWFVVASLLFGVVSEFVFWQEFTTRFNFIAVDYLIYTNEVIGNIRESYPVPWILAAIGLVVSIIVWVCHQHFSFKHTPHSLRQRLLLLIMVIAMPVLSYSIANVDQMEATHNAYTNELSGNGLFSLAAAMRRNELDYDRFYKTIPQQQADQTLAALGLKRQPLIANAVQTSNAQATSEASMMGPFKRKPKNVVLISVESLSAEYLGAYGATKGLTPSLDKIAAQGLQFDRLFATGTRTVRGLDALSLGTPPIPGQAIVHRPNNDHLTTIGELLKTQGFSTFWIYGGYGYFDNMNTYFRGNDYRVIDRTDFDDKTIASENIWGVADESLFDNALTVLDENEKSGKPFFAHIMTTSNHRPYTFPTGRVDFSQGSRDGAVKYTDYAMGRFIEQAKAKPWFKDTLFVIIADHCASAAGKTKLPVDRYHIPLIFYAPDMLKPGHYSRISSQIDVVPTLLDLLGTSDSRLFFGQSLFSAEKLPARAFISNYQELGYYKNDALIVLSPKRKTESFKIDPVTYEGTPTEIDPKLLQEAIAYYQTAAREFKQGAFKKANPQ
jgi:phosphoglycerol transferase MdoB-like AlkP superfamily enzyme